MTGHSAEHTAKVLAASIHELTGNERALALAAYRLLAEGSPVRPDALAEEAGVERSRGESWLDDAPGVFRDAEGRIIGFWGLAISEMPHGFEIDGVGLYAWCAWDTLFMPALIGKTARVRSRCKATDEEITLTVGADGVSDLSHTDAMVSMLAPADGLDADVIEAFCHHVHFFASPEAGERWLSDRDDDAFLLTVAHAYRLGELWNEHRFGKAVPA